MDAAENEHAATLGWQRLDDGFDLPQRFTGMKLGFNAVVAAQQFQVRDGFKADDLVASRRVDDEVAGDREQIGAACRHIFPIFGGIGPGHDFRAHVIQFVGGWKDAAKATA